MPYDSAGRRVATGLALAATLALAGCDDSTGPSTPPPSISTATLPDAVVGMPYSEAINASDGDGEYNWSVVTGALPPGLELSVADLGSNAALITGTPDTPGNFPFQIRVADGTGRADTASLSIRVREPPGELAVQTPALPPALVDGNYRVVLRATGGDGENFEWTVVAGTLPAGIQLGEDGQFQGVVQAPDTTTFTVEVSSAGFTARKSFTIAVVPNDPARYNITPFPVSDVPDGLEANVREAVRRWEEAIVGNQQAFQIPADTSQGFGEGSCGGFGQLVNGTAIEDIIILMQIDSIDGPGNQEDGNVLAQAGPCFIRPEVRTPILGLLILDSYDLQQMTNQERVTDIIQHEIAHVLGFGSVLWDGQFFGLLQGAGTNDPRYTGAEAVAEYQDEGGEDESIPVENEGGEGTVDSHWRTTVFGDELMTGFAPALATTNAWLSSMSIAAFADLGYEVDLSAADDQPLLSLAPYATPPDDALGWNDTEIVGVGPVVIFNPPSDRP